MRERRLLLGHMTRETVKKIASETIVVLPVAATEQHGPHLPIFTDTAITEHIAIESAAKASEAGTAVCVAPIVAYGVSDHHRPFAGVLSLGHDTFVRVLRDIGKSLVLSGFRHIFLLNGHGGNENAIGVAAEQMAADDDVVIGAASYWTLAKKELARAIDSEAIPWIPGHAGAFETACVRALHEDLIDEGNIPGPSGARRAEDFRVGPIGVHRHGWIKEIDGYTDTPSKGRATVGHTALHIIVKEVARVIGQFTGA